MNIMIISASMRGESQSLKVAKYLDNELKQKEHNSWICDLHTLGMPLFDDGETPFERKQDLSDQLSGADGYVFISPEWNGMMSHGLINMLHFVKHEMAHKPVMLVGVSSGRGGTYPVAQMKQLGQKNNHYVLSSENLIVSDVKNVFNDSHEQKSEAEQKLAARASYALDMLVVYAEALKHVQNSPVVNFRDFGNGV